MLPPWHGGRLPLHHGRLRPDRIVKEPAEKKSTGGDSNPRCRLTRAESLPLDDQCLFFRCILTVGPEGLEPSPSRLRAGDAAANTSIPCMYGVASS